MLISLGSSCKVRSAIQRHIHLDTLESNMFDWVISNFASVVYFIQHIDDPIIESDFDDSKILYLGKRFVYHTKLRFNSIHDCDANLSYENSLPLFLQKYNRRLLRLKNHILQQTKIDFIHLVDYEKNPNFPDTNLYIPTSEEISLFYEGIRKINPTCNVRLHILIPPPNCRTAKELDNKNFVFTKSEIDKLTSEKTCIHYVDQDENIDTNGHICSHWKWEKIFNLIDR